MNEQINKRLINSCNNISKQKNSLGRAKQLIHNAHEICTLDTISINNHNMRESIESLSYDIDSITNEIDKYIKDINEELIMVNRVV